MENTKTLLENAHGPAADEMSSIVKAAGYYQRANVLHTIKYEVENFIGNIKLQATLLLDPDNADWFDIDDSMFIGDLSTSSFSHDFQGNFVWLRAVYSVESGKITKISYTY